MLASTQETLLIKKVNSILIQAAKSFWRKQLLFHFSSFKTTRFILNNTETPCIASIGEYIYGTVEKTLQQHFKDNTTVTVLENNSFSLLYHIN
jgi:hypothetical protein